MPAAGGNEHARVSVDRSGGRIDQLTYARGGCGLYGRSALVVRIAVEIRSWTFNRFSRFCRRSDSGYGAYACYMHPDLHLGWFTWIDRRNLGPER